MELLVVVSPMESKSELLELLPRLLVFIASNNVWSGELDDDPFETPIEPSELSMLVSVL